MKISKLYFLFIIIVISISVPFFIDISFITEGYSNYKLDNATGNYPDAQTQVLVQNTYPPIGKNEISSNSASDIWMHYPVDTLGSYKQTTNNIRHPDNPDEGTCMPASMCGALYHDKYTGSNTVKPLPPVNDNSGTRVGYFTTE